MDYLLVRNLHIACVFVSIGLFALRGGLMLAGSRLLQQPLLRYTPHVVDTLLLTSALMLTTIIHQYPFQQAWLTVKVLGLVAYIVVGSIALKRGRTRAIRLVALVAALAIVGFIYSVARAHHPWGVLRLLH